MDKEDNTIELRHEKENKMKQKRIYVSYIPSKNLSIYIILDTAQ